MMNNKLIYRGRMRELILFDDPLTGSTLAIHPHFTPKDLANKVWDSRLKFGVDWRTGHDLSCPACMGQYVEQVGSQGHYLLFRCPCGCRYEVKRLEYYMERGAG